ncbi:RNA polymerase sigma-28 (SigD/FliA/WhiG) subunit [Hydrogenivirga caldilitoris]|uniref:RNA polymerase sigma-28 (SigD/FliA/WhiG) subunit n=1 Tax=Hydrogenivirga caldilitoris TaxID=246264 RepID=A0A497XST6_9AQUI|nr:FliA/WhiG family RNA polymerase sigma factor [Hydrogenivirga caldilitoris]RLJ70192.1 RNA polymerase sigma-28 (SigD/FliA/WhiG) subunit [Hydrogenivirga caldilitoris]
MKNPYSYGEKEREELVLKYLPLVKSIAFTIKRHIPPTIDVRDLIGHSIIGLMKALEKLDTQKNPESYLKIRIRGAIYDYLRSLDFGSRRIREKERRIREALRELTEELGREPTDEEIAEHLGEDLEVLQHDLSRISFSYILNLEDIFTEERRNYEEVISSRRADVEEEVVRKDLIEKLKEAIEKLDEREKLVIQLIFYEELPLKEIAQILNCSISRVSQIKGEAIEKLKKLMKDF